jgi:hypothetical protein
MTLAYGVVNECIPEQPSRQTNLFNYWHAIWRTQNLKGDNNGQRYQVICRQAQINGWQGMCHDTEYNSSQCDILKIKLHNGWYPHDPYLENLFSFVRTSLWPNFPVKIIVISNTVSQNYMNVITSILCHKICINKVVIDHRLSYWNEVRLITS